MESNSLNCSVFFNPARGEGCTGGKLFTITYVPEKDQKETATYLPKNANSRREERRLSQSCVQIVSPCRPSWNQLKMNYVIDEQVKCPTCWQLKYALDYTFHKLYNQFAATPILNQVQDTGPLMEFFSRLVRSATISKMKLFSRCVEAKLSQRGKEASVRQQKQEDDACESCSRLRQAMYITVSQLYEEAGVKTDFPTVQKLETYAFLVYPNGVQYPASCQTEAKRKRQRIAQDRPKKQNKRNGERKKEDVLEEENRKLLRFRIKRHKAAFIASKFVHIATALVVSFSTIVTIFLDWVKRDQPYGFRILGVMIVLFFGCIYNLYLMLFQRSFSFKNYFIIPVCWVILCLSNGKCADPLVANHICDSKIHFMSHVYLLLVFLEYYLASGIHAVLVLEINQFRRIPLKELLHYSLFNLPLMIIVFFYILYQCLSEIKRRLKTHRNH